MMQVKISRPCRPVRWLICRREGCAGGCRGGAHAGGNACAGGGGAARAAGRLVPLQARHRGAAARTAVCHRDSHPGSTTVPQLTRLLQSARLIIMLNSDSFNASEIFTCIDSQPPRSQEDFRTRISQKQPYLQSEIQETYALVTCLLHASRPVLSLIASLLYYMHRRSLPS